MSKKRKKMIKRRYGDIKQADEKKRKKISIPVVGLALLLTAAVIVIYYLAADDGTRLMQDTPAPQQAFFQKRGVLEFIDSVNGNILKEIDIEVAVSQKEKERGLMFRKSMHEDQGMLFIFEKEGLRSMWMKNTYVSLDIVFVNGKREIITIYKNTVPLSTHPMSSHKDAVYVVEVVAGFCDTYKINIGDRIRFTYQ
jgi:uncharacterized membrane protein (UPF0127 family)